MLPSAARENDIAMLTWFHYKFIIFNLSWFLSATWQLFYSSPVCFLSHPQQLFHNFVTFPVSDLIFNLHTPSPREVSPGRSSLHFLTLYLKMDSNIHAHPFLLSFPRGVTSLPTPLSPISLLSCPTVTKTLMPTH